MSGEFALLSETRGHSSYAMNRFFQRRRAGRVSHNQFSSYAIFLSLRMGRARQLMEGIGRHVSQLFAMNVQW